MSSRALAVVIAHPRDDDPIVVGVTLGERGRRSAMYGGVAAERVFVVRHPDDVASAREVAAPDDPLIIIDVREQVVMPALVEALTGTRGDRAAMQDGRLAGALRLEAGAPAALDALAAALAEPDRGRQVVEALAAGLEPVDVGPRARHPAGPGAARWVFGFLSKPELDSFLTRHVYRPLANPLTRLFVRLPFTPNMITIVAILIGQLGCVLAARPGHASLVLGLALVALPSGVLDAVDGEVARLRLQRSRAGAWLDAIGDDVLRVTMIVALGVHTAPLHPSLPIAWITAASATLTVLAMAPMWWYCITVLRSPNIQSYRALMSPPGAGSRADAAARLGAELAGRDFVDLAMLALALAGLPIVGVLGLAAGAAVAFVLVIPMHLRAVRLRRAA